MRPLATLCFGDIYVVVKNAYERGRAGITHETYGLPEGKMNIRTSRCGASLLRVSPAAERAGQPLTFSVFGMGNVPDSRPIH